MRRLSIDLPLRNDWANVDLLRTAILNCFTAVFNDFDGCRVVGTVIAELLENAIKYGRWTEEQNTLRLQVHGDDKQVEVSVENPMAPDDASVADLVRTVEWLASYPSPEDAYRAKLLEVAAAPRELGASKLGLARIAYEARCRLAITKTEDSINVTASMTY